MIEWHLSSDILPKHNVPVLAVYPYKNIKDAEVVKAVYDEVKSKWIDEQSRNFSALLWADWPEVPDIAYKILNNV